MAVIKRLFSDEILFDDRFISLSADARLLYIYMCMTADDDGFTAKSTTSLALSRVTKEALQELIDARFILCFRDSVYAIKHWRMHNSIRADRKKPTQFQTELAMLYVKSNGAYTLNKAKGTPAVICQPNDNQMTTKCQPNDNQMTTKCPHNTTQHNTTHNNTTHNNITQHNTTLRSVLELMDDSSIEKIEKKYKDWNKLIDLVDSSCTDIESIKSPIGYIDAVARANNWEVNR